MKLLELSVIFMPLLPPLGSHHVKNKRVLIAFCASTRDIKAKLHSVSFILLASTKVFILMQIAWFDIPGSVGSFCGYVATQN